MRGLYAIVDTVSLEARSLDPVRFARAIVVARPAMLQLRAKNMMPSQMALLLRELVPICSQAGVPLVANDHASAALDAGVTIVHVGQDDRTALPEGLTCGISTHTPAQLSQALETKPLYVAYGPVFQTRSKEGADPPVGLDGLREAARIAGSVPLVAIGGITLETAAAIAEIAPMGAVIAALLSDDMDEVTQRARALHSALGGR